MFLNITGGPKFVECTFCHPLKWNNCHHTYKNYVQCILPWEDINHRIYSVLLVSIRKRHHLNAISKKCAIKKAIQ